jgi:hypothetical protein
MTDLEFEWIEACLNKIAESTIILKPDEVWKPISPEIILPQGYQRPEPKKCTCGASAVNIDKHSDYCDLYVKEIK